MDFNFDFDLPQTFIEQKKKELQENQKVSTFVSQLYHKFDFETPIINKKSHRKETNINLGNPTKKRKYKTEEMKRMKKIKAILRNETLHEKELLETMKKFETKELHKEKSRIASRINGGRNIERTNEVFEFIDIVNVENEDQEKVKKKKVTYVNANKIKCDKERLENEDCVEVIESGNGNSFIPIDKSYKETVAIHETNKTLHEKNTYRFNVNWWQNQENSNKNGDEGEHSPSGIPHSDSLDPEVKKSLKRQLKPLRKHRLIATRFAPLSEFMATNMFVKDGIRDGRLIDSSESEDEVGRFEYYDNKLNEIYNPPGLIELDEEKHKKKRKKQDRKNENEKIHKNTKPNVQFNLKNREDNFSDEPVIERRLKRALIRMKNKDWKEDQLFTKGMDEDKPIEIEDIE